MALVFAATPRFRGARVAVVVAARDAAWDLVDLPGFAVARFGFADFCEAAARFVTAFFVVAAFFTVAFFVVAFFAVDFFAVDFFAVAFFVVDFFVVDVFVVADFTAVGVFTAGLAVALFSGFGFPTGAFALALAFGFALTGALVAFAADDAGDAPRPFGARRSTAGGGLFWVLGRRSATRLAFQCRVSASGDLRYAS